MRVINVAVAQLGPIQKADNREAVIRRYGLIKSRAGAVSPPEA